MAVQLPVPWEEEAVGEEAVGEDVLRALFSAPQTLKRGIGG